MFEDSRLRRIVVRNSHLPLLATLAAVSAFGYALLPVATGGFIDCIASGKRFSPALAVMFLTALAAAACEAGCRLLGAVFSHRLEAALQWHLLHVVNRLAPSAGDGGGGEELAGKFLRDVFSISAIPRDLWGNVVFAACGFAAAVAIASAKAVALGVFFAAMLPVVAFLLRPFSRRLERLVAMRRHENDRTIAGVCDFLRTLTLLKSMGAVFPLAFKTKNDFRSLAKVAVSLDTAAWMFEYLIRAVVMAGEYGILAAGGIMALHGRASLGDVVALQLLFTQTINALTNVLRILPGWTAVKDAAASVEELVLSRLVEHDCGKRVLPGFCGNVSLRNVSFGYAGRNTPVLESVSLEVRKGLLTVVKGANGTGKTTLAKLVAAAVAPASGEVLYDSLPAGELRLASLRRQIAIVSQDALLVHGTIRDNITLGATCTDEALFAAVRLCALEPTIAAKPDGLDTLLPGGEGLSGGERQRVALARLLVRQPKIVILDEVTNHLDRQGVALVLDLIPRFKSFSSILAITHDARIAALADNSITLGSA